MAEFAETVNNLQSQLTAVQAAIEGNSQASMFKPRPFTGTLSEDVNEWLAKFDRFAKFYSWTNAKKLGAIVLLFEGPALSWFQTLPEETTNNFNGLVEALKGRFGASNMDFILRQELYARRQGPVEPLASYTEDIIKRCQRLALSDNELMNIFINGLNPELKSHVVLNQPTSFTEVEKLARLREAVSKTSGVNSVTASNQSAQEQRIKELEGQVKLLMSLASPQSSSKPPSLNCIGSDNPEYYQGNDNSSEIHQAKVDIIAAIQNSAQNSAPRTLLSDRGPNFLASVVKAVCDIMNTRRTLTTAYHPQTDGLVERFNATLCEGLSMYVSTHQKDWDRHLSLTLFAYRVAPHATTGESPFYPLYGREPRLPLDASLLLPDSNLSNSVAELRARIVKNLEESRQIVSSNTQLAQQRMKACRRSSPYLASSF